MGSTIIRAHGGKENVEKTLTGSFRAVSKITIPPMIEAMSGWEEVFNLPRRYKRTIKGTIKGEKFELEYAVSEEDGWKRENRGVVSPIPGDKQLLEKSWH